MPGLRRADNPSSQVVLTGRMWNDLADLVERSRIEVVAPLQKLMEGSEGIVLGCRATSGPQAFQVTSLPNASSGTVAPYVTAVTYNNGSTGTANTSISITTAHDVGDLVYAYPMSPTYYLGAPFQDSSGKLITWQEVGEYRSYFATVLNQSGGSAGGYNSGSGGLDYCSFTYDILTPNGTTVLQTAATPIYYGNRIIPITMTAATRGTVFLAKPNNSNRYTWQLVYADERGAGDYCDTSGGE